MIRLDNDQISNGPNTTELKKILKLISSGPSAIIISDYETARDSIKKIKPNFYFKGKDYKKSSDKNLNIEKKLVTSFGGKIIFTNTPLNSSSEIINKKFLYLINKDNFYIHCYSILPA